MTERRPAPPTQKPSDEARRGAQMAFGNSSSNKPGVKPKLGIRIDTGTGDGNGGKKEDNGALAAARSVGRGRTLEGQHTGSSTQGRVGARGGVRSSNLDVALERQDTGGNVAGNDTAGSRKLRPRLAQHSLVGSGTGAGYLQASTVDIRSPSFIAATLAASRSASLSPNHTGRKGVSQRFEETCPVLRMGNGELRIPERHSSRSPSVMSGSERTSTEMVLDTRSIPPTGNLTGMFEQNAGAGAEMRGKGQVVKKAKTPNSVIGVQETIASTPTRMMTPSSLANKAKTTVPVKEIPERTASAPTRVRTSSPLVMKAKAPTPIKETPPRITSTSTRARTPSPLINKAKKPPPQPKSPKPVIHNKSLLVPPSLTSEPVPQKRRIQPLVQERRSSQPPSISKIPPVIQERMTSLPPSNPIPVPFRTLKPLQPQNSSSSTESFVSASEIQQPSYEEHKLSWRAELASQNRRRLKSGSLHTLDSYAAANSLADAIVASSIASSRAVSPSKSLYNVSSGANQIIYPPLPPPRRVKYHHHNSAHLFHNGKNDISRTPSPGKLGNGNGGTGHLKTTMRKGDREEVDEGEKRRGRMHLMKKAPNKHHEGDRKRWRDSVTERERKRYEAVWASNRGLYTGDAPGAENEVCSLVVRDVWSRSRLDEVVLEEAYALVDRRGVGRLEREEFVVGMWLVDQRLKGRKLPVRVSESVWKSVGVLSGIKVRKMK